MIEGRPATLEPLPADDPIPPLGPLLDALSRPEVDHGAVVRCFGVGPDEAVRPGVAGSRGSGVCALGQCPAVPGPRRRARTLRRHPRRDPLMCGLRRVYRLLPGPAGAALASSRGRGSTSGPPTCWRGALGGPGGDSARGSCRRPHCIRDLSIAPMRAESAVEAWSLSDSSGTNVLTVESITAFDSANLEAVSTV